MECPQGVATDLLSSHFSTTLSRACHHSGLRTVRLQRCGQAWSRAHTCTSSRSRASAFLLVMRCGMRLTATSCTRPRRPLNTCGAPCIARFSLATFIPCADLLSVQSTATLATLTATDLASCLISAHGCQLDACCLSSPDVVPETAVMSSNGRQPRLILTEGTRTSSICRSPPRRCRRRAASHGHQPSCRSRSLTAAPPSQARTAHVTGFRSAQRVLATTVGAQHGRRNPAGQTPHSKPHRRTRVQPSPCMHS